MSKTTSKTAAKHKLWYLVEKERSGPFPPIQTYQSCLESVLQFDDDAPAGSTATDWERLPPKVRETIEGSERARFVKSLLSAFFVDEESAKAAAKAKLEKWNSHILNHNKERPDDPRSLYTSDDIVVKCFEIPATWDAKDAEVTPVPQPRSCANCVLRMVEHDLERRSALGCLIHPDDQICNPSKHICGCWRGKEAVHVSE